jgi:hypothetical protein
METRESDKSGPMDIGDDADIEEWKNLTYQSLSMREREKRGKERRGKERRGKERRNEKERGFKVSPSSPSTHARHGPQ